MLDMPLDSLVSPAFAIDGRTMVVVADDSNLHYTYVMFYTLEDNGWEQRQHFVQEYFGGGHLVALSGGTVFVGFQNNGQQLCEGEV